MKHLNFKDQRLNIDWIGFNIQGFVDPKPIATYFFEQLHFNTTLTTKNNGKWETKYLNYHSKNQFQVAFRQYEYKPEAKSFWTGTKISYSGRNASEFYNIIQTQTFDWTVLTVNQVTLSRFDLCYEKHIAQHSLDQLIPFLRECQNVIQTRSKRIVSDYKTNATGLKLTIGSRQSANFYRIYCRKSDPNLVRFELEIKKNLVQKFQKYLFEYNFTILESTMVKHFYEHSDKILQYNNLYTDWLIDYVRKRNVQINSKSLHIFVPYLKKEPSHSIEDQINSFTMISFLTFSKKHIDHNNYTLDNKHYPIQFKLTQFMKFINIPINQYQLTKSRQYFEKFTYTTLSTKIFTEEFLQNIVRFPSIKILKKNRAWVIQAPIIDRLYLYSYPFALSSSLLIYNDRYQLQVRFAILQSFCTLSLTKTFFVTQFLSKFSTTPPQKRAYIKKLILDQFNELQRLNYINNTYIVILKSKEVIHVHQLNISLVRKAQSIEYYEYIQRK